MARKRFFLLDETCQKEEVVSMMCRVVVDYRLPLKEYAPVEPIGGTERRHNPQDIIPDILPKPSLSNSRRDFIKQLTADSAKLVVTDYFGLNGKRSKEETVELESRAVYRYSLKQPGQYFQHLLKDELYERDVRSLLKKHGKGYLVVGFLTTEGATWKLTAGKGKSMGVNFKVPVSSATGGPPQLDPTIELSHDQENAGEHSYAAEETEVFAVAYDVVSLKHHFDTMAQHYVRKDIEHGPPKRIRAKHNAFGDDDGGSEDEVEEEEEIMAEGGIVSAGQDFAVNEQDIFSNTAGDNMLFMDI
ncbi:uncharacterized protein HMPREF1541_10174 [Cyphellophora europaea CBS 101466]|uniref:Uncharacterized protein n=1 Tax=Cyphellophora europaea (strain CBS 101466) TaxID=1220924 RepID=W2S9C3_CYPE1|nr:uncharacterized protein HMPREF1541_10174 [Cyphellophora europaea CBS 101466]ETN44504.1 hypothetical protein HMPREF1541_10174 [Cyphellophora europaea CBS 101466]